MTMCNGSSTSQITSSAPRIQPNRKSLLAVRVALRREFDRFQKQVLAMARCDTRARLLMSVPGVDAIVSLTFASAIDDPARFKSSKQVGAYLGLTPTKYQSGETDIDGRISKIGDVSVRTVLYEAANIILTKPLKGCTALKSWAMKLARRSGMKKAKVALARKIAVIMHRMLADCVTFRNVAAV
jgi:transposase